MRDFHEQSSKTTYYQWQYENARDYVLPFVQPLLKWDQPLRIMEIGCAEGGVLKAFIEHGHFCTGVELSASRADFAREFGAEYIANNQLEIITRDIYDIDADKDLSGKYDLVILKDVIEHIHDQGKFIQEVRKFLNPGGQIFFGFPPWCMPFGGHQQIAVNKLMSKLPYYHLLPMPLYRGVLKAFGETPEKVDHLAEIKETGISIERFQRLVKREGFAIKDKKFFLFNPIYRFKFGVKPRVQTPLISGVPVLRNFLTTAVWYVIG